MAFQGFKRLHIPRHRVKRGSNRVRTTILLWQKKLIQELADAILKYGPPTSGTAFYRLEPEHRRYFKNAEYACKHLIEKLGTPVQGYMLRHKGELRALFAECGRNLQNAELIIVEKK